MQRRILELLVPIVELSFHKQSFGYRSKKGSHDALKYVNSYWSNVAWIIKLYIKKYFCRINFATLLTKMHNYTDQSSLKLICKFWEIGRVKENRLIQSSQILEQITNGFILLPLLCNIYFHDLDVFILKNLIDIDVQKGTRATVSGYPLTNCLDLENSKVLQVCRKFKKSGHSSSEEIFLDKNILWKIKFNFILNKLFYVRCISNFMIGYIGDRLQANDIYNIVVNYIYDYLKFVLYPDEAVVVSSTKSVKYLGTRICWAKILWKKSKICYKVALLCWPSLKVPLEDLFMIMVLKKYFSRRAMHIKIVRAISFRRVLDYDVFDILKSFNGVIRDLLHYYSFVSCRSKLWKILDVCRNSCAKTIARKLNLKTAIRVFSKCRRFLIFENNLSKKVVCLEAWPYTLKTKKKFNIKDFKTGFNLLVKTIDNYVLYLKSTLHVI